MLHTRRPVVALSFASLFVAVTVTPASSASAQSRPARPPARSAAPAAAPAAAAAAPATYQVGDKVEVREGDTWSAATVLKTEGRKIQIKYTDGDTEEWVTADRVRTTEAGAASAGGAPTTSPADGAQTRKAPNETFKIGARVEVKNASRWTPATVKNRDGDLYLIVYDRWESQTWWEWVPVAIVRTPGSDKEFYDWGRGVKVGSGSVQKAKEEAKRTFANIDAEIAANAKGEKKDPFAPTPYDKPVTPADRKKVKELLPGGGPKVLAQFDPFPATPKIAERGYVLHGGDGQTFNRGPAALVMGGRRAMAVYTGGHGSETRTSGVELLDLVSGDNLGGMKFDPLSMPIAVSPSGNRAAGRAHGFFSNTKSRLDIFDLKNTAEPKHVISFQPYAAAAGKERGGHGDSRDIGWAAFPDEDHILTCSTGGELTMWDAPNATAVWTLGVRSGSSPALSPGGKQIAILTSDALVVIDSLTGKELCSIPQSRPARQLAFTPDGKRVVGSDGGGVVSFWDLAKGEWGGDIGVGARGEAIPANGRFVLVGGTDLLDLDKRVVVWQYTGASSSAAQGFGGRCFVITTKDRRTVLVAATLPNDSALKTADKLQLGQALLLRPGGSVSINVTVEGPEEQRQGIIAALTEQLRQSNITVDPASPIKLFARTETGKTNTQTYQIRKFGSFETSTETVSSTEKLTKLGFEYNGKVAWETVNSSGAYLPSMVMTTGGKSINETVQAQNKYSAGYLASVRVPNYLPVPTDQPWAGSSHWTVQGVADDRAAGIPPGGLAVKAMVREAGATPAAPGAKAGDGLE
jgi:WD40 repeat protein